jgi:hypothetical protein
MIVNDVRRVYGTDNLTNNPLAVLWRGIKYLRGKL